MRNSEEAMEKVLAGLRDAEAPAGMERRILNALEERVAARSRPGWRQMLPVWLVVPARPMAVGCLVCGVTLAGLLAVVLAIPAIRRPGHAPAQARKNRAPVGSSASGALGVEAKSVLPASARPRVRFLGERKGEGGTNAGSTEASLDIDSVALEDLHAPSRPAPPMPLTEQERLLLRLIHKDDPVELAMLDSKVRDLEELEDKAEFQRFFGQSTKQALPEQPMTEQASPEQSTTEQAMPGKTGTEPSVPEQPVPEQQAPDQPMQPQAAPERVGPDQSTTQQATPRPTRTGDNE
jgi:heat shock protein HslJ